MRYIPTQVILEVSSLCNLRCKGCAIHGPQSFVTRPIGIMAEDIWQTVISEIGTWGKEVNLTTHGGGEPLLHPHLKDIIRFAKTFANIRIGFLTNGMLFDENWSEFAISEGLEWIAFSIDGVDPKTHRIVRKKSDLELIEHNLSILLNLKRKSGSEKPAVALNMVAYPEVIDQTELFVKKWLNKVDTITVSHYRNPPDSRRWNLVPQQRSACFLLWSQMVIASDGRLGLCCEDFNADASIGSVGEKSLLDLWNGYDISELRQQHERGEFDTHPMCRICDTWADNIVQKTEDKPDIGCRLHYRASQTEYKSLLYENRNTEK